MLSTERGLIFLVGSRVPTSTRGVFLATSTTLRAPTRTPRWPSSPCICTRDSTANEIPPVRTRGAYAVPLAPSL